MIKKFRKKPIEIEAIQWDGSKQIWNELKSRFAKIYFDSNFLWIAECSNSLMIQTLEGIMEARLGDWVIKGIKGEIYPCKPDIFEATYELVEDAPES